MFQTADSSVSNALEEVANAGPLLHQSEFLENDKENTVWPKSSKYRHTYFGIVTFAISTSMRYNGKGLFDQTLQLITEGMFRYGAVANYDDLY
jgi:hypothetical protein